jgi:hypothetical protein
MNTVMPKRTPALTTLTLVAGWLLTVRWLSTWARWRKWGERCMGPSETRLQGQTNMQGVSIDFTNCNLGNGTSNRSVVDVEVAPATKAHGRGP